MSGPGQSLPKWIVRAMSAFTPIATELRVEIFEMLAQPLAALMAKGNNLAMCPRRNRGDVPLMGGAFLTRALGSLVQVCKDRDEGISIRNRF
jgi:hypothetical protein